MLDEIVGVIDDFSEYREISVRRNIPVRRLMKLAVRKFDREFVDEPTSTESFMIEESGPVSYEAARLLYSRLGRWFAQHGVKKMSAAERKKYGRAGAEKRWGGKDS